MLPTKTAVIVPASNFWKIFSFGAKSIIPGSSVGNIFLSDIVLFAFYSFVRNHYLCSDHCKAAAKSGMCLFLHQPIQRTVHTHQVHNRNPKLIFDKQLDKFVSLPFIQLGMAFFATISFTTNKPHEVAQTLQTLLPRLMHEFAYVCYENFV